MRECFGHRYLFLGICRNYLFNTNPYQDNTKNFEEEAEKLMSLNNSINMAVYRGPSNPASELSGYETWVNRPMNAAVAFLATDSWANQQWPDWQANLWAGITTPIMLGAIAFPAGGYWAAAASGSYDTYWQTLGQRLVDTGHPNTILRFAHEFNGSWYHWRVPLADVTNYITAYRRFVEVTSAVPSSDFHYVWNPAIHQHPYPYFAERAYPGIEYVDEVGIDVYDNGYSTWRPGVDPQPTATERSASWDKLVNGDHGMMFWRNFAAAERIDLGMPEVGLWIDVKSDGTSQGGGDNPYFIEQIYRFAHQHVRGTIGFWEKPGMGVYDSDSHPSREVDTPSARAKFLELWKDQ